jgi:N,N'-diacetyllegionaminate synthase|tara:strand:- start:693 stop:1427 length:735 start_codon:yes stop_codon:yes gene_type:complete
VKNLKTIAEVGSNWNGDISLGKKIIKQVKNSGSDFVKFQMWKTDELISKSDKNWKYMKKSEFSKSSAKQLKNYSDNLKIGCFWSVFYPEAVNILEDLDVQYYKVASWTAALKHPSALDTLKEIAKTKKPVLISMGFGGNIKKIKNIFKNNKIYFLYCVADYPTKVNQIDFKQMQKFDGFSDHTEGYLTSILYANTLRNSNQTKFLEKHVCVKESIGPDKPFAMDVSDFAKMMNEIQQISSISKF